MKYQSTMLGKRSTMILSVVAAGLMAGCGGETTTEPEKAEAPAPAAPSTKSTKTRGSKDPSRQLAPGGDLGVRERRALKQKEREAAGKS